MEGSNSTCLNCKAFTEGNYCSNCGQKNSDARNKSILTLLSHLFSNFSFVDNRVVKSFFYLLFKPGQLTVRYIDGERKKFLNPINLFLFINIIFFLSSPVKDYYLSLNSQVKSQYYSEFTLKLVKEKLESENLTYADFAKEYDEWTPKLSKISIILNIPLIAIWLYPVVRKRRKYFYDTLILAIHFFSLFLLCSILLKTANNVLPDSFQGFSDLTLIILLTVHCSITMRKFLKYNIAGSIGLGLYLLMSALFALGLYRGLIFLITYAYIS